MLDGGWHFSSPLIRKRSVSEGGALVIEHSDCLSMIAETIVDIDRVADHLSVLAEQAEQLGVDAKALCGADLPLLARTYKALGVAIGNAANDAVEALTLAAASKPRGRKPKVAQVGDSGQTSLLDTTASKGAES